MKQQGFVEYEILEEHEDMETASKREKELQKQYGYRIDSGYALINKLDRIAGGKASATKQWLENRERELEKGIKGNKIVSEKYSKTIIQYDLDGNFIKEWKGMKEAARTLNIKPPNLTATLKGRQKTCGGFLWKYKN